MYTYYCKETGDSVKASNYKEAAVKLFHDELILTNPRADRKNEYRPSLYVDRHHGYAMVRKYKQLPDEMIREHRELGLIYLPYGYPKCTFYTLERKQGGKQK